MPITTQRLMKACLAAGAATLVLGSAAFAGKKDDTIRFAYEQVPESVDPYFNNVRIGVIMGQLGWDTLIHRDPVTNEYRGQLAKSWKWVDDKTLDFDLREGIKFHNGEEFDADDVVYTFNFVGKPENKVVTQTNVNWIESAEKLGKFQVRVKLKRPFPAAIEYLAGPVIIHPNEYYAKVGPKGMNEKPVGTGPYKIVEHVIGKSIKLAANPDYPAALGKNIPKIKNLEIRFLPDRQTQTAEVMAENLDFIMGVAVDQALGMKAVPHLQVVEGETMRIVFLNFNLQDGSPTPALKDIRVRKAIAHAIPKAAMVKQLVGDKARMINVICFPTQFGCDDTGAPRYAYDPTKARELMKEAGFGGDKKLELDIYAYRERDQTEAMIGALRSIGVTANLKFMQYAAMREQIRTNKVPISHQTWGSFSVNDVSASTPNYFKFHADDMARDPEVRDLLEKGDSSVDPAVRKEAYKKALTMIQEKALAVPLYSLTTHYVANGALKFATYPDEIPRFWEMSWK
ncbi:MAG: peptide/nickel transport system substrate-binding [Beijerinckiaceae bacterium]|nr:MAG: peptide/nickel transport system substrate-binding [Beijerinckiaceae bacterium]